MRLAPSTFHVRNTFFNLDTMFYNSLGWHSVNHQSINSGHWGKGYGCPSFHWTHAGSQEFFIANNSRLKTRRSVIAGLFSHERVFSWLFESVFLTFWIIVECEQSLITVSLHCHLFIRLLFSATTSVFRKCFLWIPREPLLYQWICKKILKFKKLYVENWIKCIEFSYLAFFCRVVPMIMLNLGSNNYCITVTFPA